MTNPTLTRAAFFGAKAENQSLLHVRPGLPTSEALSFAYCITDCAQAMVECLANDLESQNGECRMAWGIAYLLDTANALIRSADEVLA